MKNKLIIDGRYLDHSYVPDKLPGREEQIGKLMDHQCDCYVKSRNAIITGDRGTGKTAVARKVCTSDIPEMLRDKGFECRGVLVNCKQSNTRFQVYQHMIFQLTGEDYTRPSEQSARMKFLKLIKNMDCLIVVLDEADMLEAKHRDILYDLSRFQEQGLTECRISVVAISNDLRFVPSLDSKTRSSLCQEEFIFEPYDTNELENILEERAKIALIDNSYTNSIINHIACIAAQEEGDARYAIHLLAKSAEIAGRRDYDTITIDCVRKARGGVEEERVRQVVGSLVFQKKLMLMGCVTAIRQNNGGRPPTTGDVTDHYMKHCRDYAISPVTERRAADFIGDLANLGIISKRLVNRGRYGRTHEITMNASIDVVEDVVLGEQGGKRMQQQRLLDGD